MNHRDRTICEKIIGYCDEIDSTNEAFKNDKGVFYSDKDGFIYRNALAMPTLQIGELSKNLSEEFTKKYPGVPWSPIKGMRDKLAHHYGKLDKDMLWETTHGETGELREYLKSILK